MRALRRTFRSALAMAAGFGLGFLVLYLTEIYTRWFEPAELRGPAAQNAEMLVGAALGLLFGLGALALLTAGDREGGCWTVASFAVGAVAFASWIRGPMVGVMGGVAGVAEYEYWIAMTLAPVLAAALYGAGSAFGSRRLLPKTTSALD